MMSRSPIVVLLAAVSFAVVSPSLCGAQTAGGARITSPKEEFGHNFGDDYFLANYKQIFGVLAEARSRVKEFIENGGTVIAIGESATSLAAFRRLPIENHLVENGAPLPRTKFYVPGSVLRARVDTSHAIASGMAPYTDFFFDDSPVFNLGPGAAAAGVTALAWFDSPEPLRSGWAWGQRYLENGVLAAEAKIGRGKAILFGPEILKRAQPHATFKLLFNSIYESAVR